MPASNEIKIKITIDGNEAVGSLELTQEHFDKLRDSIKNTDKSVPKLGDSLTTMRNVMQGITEVGNLLNNTFGDSIKAFQDAEVAENKLVTAMQANGSYTPELVQSFKEYAAVLQQKTIFEDDAFIKQMAMFQAMGLNTEQTKEASLQAANLASLMGTDLASSTKVMADLFAGDATMIKRYVKGLDDSILKSGDMTKIMDMLNKSIGGQAEALKNTSSGGMQQMNNALGNMQENAGALIVKVLHPFIKLITDLATYLNKVSPAIAGLVLSLGGLTAAYITLRLTGIIPTTVSATAMWTAITGPIGLAVIAFTSLLYIFTALGEEADKIADPSKYSVEERTKEIERLTKVIEGQKKRLSSNPDNADYKFQLEQTEAKLKKFQDTFKETTEAIDSGSKKQTEGAFSYFGALKRVAELDTQYNRAVLAGNEKEKESTKKTIDELKEKIKAYENLHKTVKKTPDVADEKLTPAKLADVVKTPATIKGAEKVTVADVKFDDGSVNEMSKRRAEVQIEWEKKTTDEKIAALEDRLSAELLSAEEQKRIEDDLFNYRLQKYQDERLARQQMIQEMQQMWHGFYDDIIHGNTTVEEAMDRVWQHIRDNVILAIGDIVIAHIAGEQTMTASTQMNTFQRIASRLMEIAATVWNAYLSFFSWAGPLAPLLAGAGVVGTIAMVKSGIKAIGFDQGGRFVEGKPGFFEGNRKELIAPESDFKTIMRNELIPQVLERNVNVSSTGSPVEMKKLAKMIGQEVSDNVPRNWKMDALALAEAVDSSNKLYNRNRL